MTIAPRTRAVRARRPTTTATFGSGRRESHDASGFYRRFVAPEISSEETVALARRIDVVHRRDARDMGVVESDSVALVVTSPPYFAGKEYEESLGTNGVPATYFEYLGLLSDVFAECKRVLEPGGRIAVNVANLGRRPYRSLSGDVAGLLEDLGLLLRGEVVWWKGRAAGGSCAWGTFQRPANPVLRDVTERVVIASKGRFDRAPTPQRRAELGLPSVTTISRDEFLEATTDLWEIPPESATRVGHPAPFPVELPARLIELFTYEGDVVLDPFLGSGTTAVAAIRSGRHFIGFDTDAGYVARARARIRQETQKRRRQDPPGAVRVGPSLPASGGDPFSQGLRDGLQAKELAVLLLETCGFDHVRSDVKLPGRVIEAHLVATDAAGTEWLFELAGSLTTGRSGLRRSEVLWRCLGRTSVLAQARPASPIVIITTDRPASTSGPGRALAAVTGAGRPVHDVVELLDPAGHDRLRAYARGRAAR